MNFLLKALMVAMATIFIGTGVTAEAKSKDNSHKESKQEKKERRRAEKECRKQCRERCKTIIPVAPVEVDLPEVAPAEAETPAKV